MAYSKNDLLSIPTLTDALQSYTVDYLKKLAALASDGKYKPTRKADLIALILRKVNCESGQLRQVENDPLQGFWRKLDTLQQAAVAEVAHGPDARFNSARFQAKYGQSPNWGIKGQWEYLPNPSLLGLFFHQGIMPDDLRRRFRSFVPKPEAVELASQDEIPETWQQRYDLWNPETGQREKRIETIPIVKRLTDRAAIHDLKAVLRLVDASKLAVRWSWIC